jgi:hypothetical protein
MLMTGGIWYYEEDPDNSERFRICATGASLDSAWYTVVAKDLTEGDACGIVNRKNGTCKPVDRNIGG